MSREIDALYVERCKLCDLLLGRWFRLQAAHTFERALGFEQTMQDVVSQAAQCERFAALSEQGRVVWGGRHDRYGMQPEDYDATADGSALVISRDEAS